MKTHYKKDYIDDEFLPQHKKNYVQPNNLGKSFRLLMTKLNIKIRFHDIRHTHASLLFKKIYTQKLFKNDLVIPQSR